MKLSLHDKSILYHELAKLTASGFGFDKSADLLRQQAPNRACAAFAAEASHRLHQGQSIASALHQPHLGSTPLDLAVITASEKGGVLEAGFAYLRDLYTSQRRTRQAILARLLYPGLLLHVAVFLPVFPPLILGQPAGPEMRASLALLLAVYASILLATILWNLLQRLAHHSLLADRLLSLLPLLGKARRLAALQRFATVFRFSLLAALRTSEALLAAGAASGSALLSSATTTLARHAEQGQTLASLLPQLRPFPADFRRSLASAEAAGGLDTDLHSWSQSFTHELETHLVRTVSLLPMAATALVAVLVGWRLFSLYFGMLQNQSKLLDSLW